MTPLTSTIAPTVQIRAQTISMLTREFGLPESGDGFERWVIKPPAPHYPVHVVVNAPATPQRAHVLVFNPGARSGGQVLEMQILTVDQCTRLVEHIKQMRDAPHQPSDSQPPPTLFPMS